MEDMYMTQTMYKDEEQNREIKYYPAYDTLSLYSVINQTTK